MVELLIIVSSCYIVVSTLIQTRWTERAPALLSTLGVILAFLLLNLEIADYFTTAGEPSLVFRFSGNFARDMTYTIAWAVFALVLVVAGIWRKLRAARYAGLVLLSVTLLKLFFHDLARLNQLYRIGATHAVPETLESSLQLSEAVLVDLGYAMGPVIASIHEKRDEFRDEIMRMGELDEKPRLRSSRLSEKASGRKAMPGAG